MHRHERGEADFDFNLLPPGRTNHFVKRGMVVSGWFRREPRLSKS